MLPLMGQVAVRVRVSDDAPLAAILRIWGALGDLPACNLVEADPPGSRSFRVITHAVAQLVTEIEHAPALAGAELSFTPEDGFILRITGPLGLPVEEQTPIPAHPIEAEPARAEPAEAEEEQARGGFILPGQRGGKSDRTALYIPPRTVAVVIPAHNEEAVIGATLRSVIECYDPRDVYVFSDGSTDATVTIARSLLPEENVIDHRPPNLGKSRGLEYMMRTIIFPRGYVYVTICDADTTMEPDFLTETLKVLRHKDVACAVGQVKSRWYPKNLISVYRTYGYMMWQMLYKRLQSITNSVTIASGCSTTWKTRVLKQLEFDHLMSTEDFSLTIQVHRKRLGQIKYVSSAVVWTQDPFSVTSYRKQMYRWDRAWWEAVRKYRVGLHWFHMKDGVPRGVSILDISTLLLTFDIFAFIFSVLLLPLMIVLPFSIDLGVWEVDSRRDAVIMMAWQYGSVVASAGLVALLARRPRIFLYSPLFLILMYVDIFVSLQALVSTARSQYRQVRTPAGATVASVWVSPERREVA